MDFPKSVPGVGLVAGRYVDENQATGQPGTLITAQAMNALTDELLAVITGAGLAPDEASHSQLLEALTIRSSNGAIAITAAGVTQWQVPDVLKRGLMKATVLVVGAGGSGARISSTTSQSGSGGAGGGWVQADVSLKGVATVACTVAQGGAAPAAVGAGVAGGTSSFGTFLSASGGSGGTTDFAASGLGAGGSGVTSIAGALIGIGTSGYATPIGGAPGGSILGAHGGGFWGGSAAAVAGSGSGSGLNPLKGGDGVIFIKW